MHIITDICVLLGSKNCIFGFLSVVKPYPVKRQVVDVSDWSSASRRALFADLALYIAVNSMSSILAELPWDTVESVALSFVCVCGGGGTIVRVACREAGATVPPNPSICIGGGNYGEERQLTPRSRPLASI